MTRDTASSPLRNMVLKTFPCDSQTIVVLSLRDRQFRSLLEDLLLAQEALERFEAGPDADRRPEVPEYRTIIRELEDDVRAYVATSERHSGSR